MNNMCLPCGVAMTGLMYLRKKKPPMNELILSDEASGNFSCVKKRNSIYLHVNVIHIPHGLIPGKP